MTGVGFHVLLLCALCVARFPSRVIDSIVLEYLFDEQEGTVVNDYGSAVGTKSGAWDLNVLDASAAEWLGAETGMLLNRSKCDVDLYGEKCIVSPLKSSGGSIADLRANFENSLGFTFSVWVRPSSKTQDGFVADVTNVNVGADAWECATVSLMRSFSVRQTTETFSFEIVNFDDTARKCFSVPGTTKITPRALYHVVMTAPSSSSGAYTLYVNGKLEGSVLAADEDDFNLGWGLLSNRQLTLGGTINGRKPWRGTLYYAALHIRTLSHAEVVQNYEAGPYEYTPVAESARAECLEDGNVTITLRATDPFDDTFMFSIVSLPAVGTLTALDGSPLSVGSVLVTGPYALVVYAPPVQSSGVSFTSFEFSADDTQKNATGVIVVDVIARNHLPFINVSTGPLFVDFGQVESFSVFASDADGDTLSVIVESDTGLLSLPSSSGVTFVVGDGTSDTGFKLRGRTAAVNAALSLVNYESLVDGGTDTIAAVVIDERGAREKVSLIVHIASVCS